jgi:hypothetical protein
MWVAELPIRKTLNGKISVQTYTHTNFSLFCMTFLTVEGITAHYDPEWIDFDFNEQLSLEYCSVL